MVVFQIALKCGSRLTIGARNGIICKHTAFFVKEYIVFLVDNTAKINGIALFYMAIFAVRFTRYFSIYIIALFLI